MRPDALLRRFVLVLAATVFGAAAWAAPTWNTLDARQQALIKPALQSQGGNFDQLSEARRAALVTGADRWLAMTPSQRATATQQFQQWQRLGAEQKAVVLERRERFRKLSPEQRKALLETHKQFLEMPLQQQTDLREQFKDLQPVFDGLPAQPFGTPASPSAPSSPAPLGLPVTGLPSGSATTLPPLTR